MRRLWTELRATPFPGGRSRDPRLHEIALYDAWLAPLVEAALVRGGRLTVSHAAMLEQRRQEGNRALWSAAAEVGEGTRTYVARLLNIEEELGRLPMDE